LSCLKEKTNSRNKLSYMYLHACFFFLFILGWVQKHCFSFFSIFWYQITNYHRPPIHIFYGWPSSTSSTTSKFVTWCFNFNCRSDLQTLRRKPLWQLYVLITPPNPSLRSNVCFSVSCFCRCNSLFVFYCYF